MAVLNELNLDQSEIKNPPVGFMNSIRFIGPGLILSAAIVGSGELIATTSLGAKAGYQLLWVILLGCMVKVAVQLEYGRFCIHYGKTALQAWNHVGNRKIWNNHWSVYIAVLYMIATFFGQAGVLGGASQVANYAFPSIPIVVWVVILVIVIGSFVSQGKYGFVEWISIVLNFVFVASVLYCVSSLYGTPFAFTVQDLATGLSFTLPHDSETIGFALAAFGITGVAAGEITIYPYWCLEKGYAKWTGPKEDSPEWYARAKGWQFVMVLDALVSMIVYTIATCAFYILGASVLRHQEKLMDGNDLIVQLSAMFTNVLGEHAKLIFMVCSFVVLFSTVFANTAGFSRMWVDFFSQCNWVDWNQHRHRTRVISYMAWVFPIVCGIIYFLIQKPLFLVIFMGISNSLFLLVVAYITVIFRYKYTDKQLQPSVGYDIALWISLFSIAFMAAQGVQSLVKSIS